MKLAEGWLQAGNEAEFTACIENLLESSVRLDEEAKAVGVRTWANAYKPAMFAWSASLLCCPVRRVQAGMGCPSWAITMNARIEALKFRYQKV